MVEALDWWMLMTAESKSGDERVERLTHIIREDRVDGLTIKIDGERVERLTHKIREERVDGLTSKIDEEGADGWFTKTCEERAMGGPAEKRSNRCLWTGRLRKWWMQSGSSHSLH